MLYDDDTGRRRHAVIRVRSYDAPPLMPRRLSRLIGPWTVEQVLAFEEWRKEVARERWDDFRLAYRARRHAERR